MFEEKEQVKFPEFSNIVINMMPVIHGDINSLPENIKPWHSIISKCDFRLGSTVYLTIHESFVEQGHTQRRPGLHTDGFDDGGWGGGWGRGEGIYMASSDGLCKVYDCVTYEVDSHGSLLPRAKQTASKITSIKMKPSVLYWLTDATPHESLPAVIPGNRQFFRLVSEDVSVWYTQHNTPNPLGIQPKAPIVDYNKFEL